MKKILTFILTFITQLALPFFAYSEQYICQQIPEKGTILSTVNCIYREANSMVWIGTHKGLYCYDGDRLQQFSHSEDSLSLPGNSIYEISKDIQGNFWILTNEGIALYNKKKNEFHPITHGKEIQKTVAYSHCQTEKGVFFGGADAIYHWDYLTRQFTCFKQLPQKKSLIIQNIQVLSPGKLLCTSRDKGIFILDIHSKTWSEAPFKCSKEISSVLVDKQQRVWVAEYNHGLHCYDSTGKEQAFYDRTNSALSNNIILCLAEQDSCIWIGTDGGGINILNPQTNKIDKLTYYQTNSYFLPVNSVKCFYKDSNKSMWAGSIRNGVINIKKSLIKTYTDIGTGNKTGLSNPTVLCLFQEKDSPYIWVGTDGEGINKLNTRTHEFTHFHKGQQTKVASIASYLNNKLLLSIYSKGLYIFDVATGTMTELPIQDSKVNEQIRYTQKTTNLYNETSHSILLLNQHIYRYDLFTQQTEQVIPTDGKPTNGLFFPIGASNGKLLLHDSYTIYTLIPRDVKAERLFRVPQGITINSGSLDPQGNIWLATNIGIYCYLLSENKLIACPTTLFKEANSIICGKQGKVWIGANNRLYAYLIREKRFAILSESDGAILNEFLEKPRLLTSQGDIYMGGIKGLLYINHQFTIDTSDKPIVRLTDIHIDGNKVTTDNSDNTPSLIFPWGSKALDLWVTSLEKDLFRPRIYRFSITGTTYQQFDSFSPQITLRLLPPGRHDVYVSCNTRSGEWTEPTLILSINALLPWYQAGWFILLVTILLAAGIIIVFITILRRKENKLRFAMKEREKDIYEEKVRFLINISHELRTPLTLIHAPLKRILQKLPSADENYTTLSKIYRQSCRMKEMLNMVLDLRKMEVKQQKLQIQSYPFNEWVEETVNDFISEGEAMDIQIHTTLDPSITNVNFDKKKCDIILTNLLTNALKHSPHGSNIQITSNHMFSDRIRVSVIDQGPGLQNIDPEQLFTRFYQGSEEKKWNRNRIVLF